MEVLTKTFRKSGGAQGRASALVCGETVIHFDSRRVRNPAGVVSLEPRALELLRCLVDRPGEVLTRGALIDAVWGDGEGSDEALSQAIAKLRRALGDDARAPRFVETVSKSGYRWVFEDAPPSLAATPAPRIAPAKPATVYLLLAASLAGAVVMAGLGGAGTLAYVKAAHPRKFEIHKHRLVKGVDGVCASRLEIIKGFGVPTAADLALPAADVCGALAGIDSAPFRGELPERIG